MNSNFNHAIKFSPQSKILQDPSSFYQRKFNCKIRSEANSINFALKMTYTVREEGQATRMTTAIFAFQCAPTAERVLTKRASVLMGGVEEVAEKVGLSRELCKSSSLKLSVEILNVLLHQKFHSYFVRLPPEKRTYERLCSNV